LIREGGQDRADWMTSMFRNLSLYPNLHLLDQMATLIRHFRPIAVDKTEITFYCIAPIDEPAEDRLRRLRQFEEFFMASGMGSPDDNAIFEECQYGVQGREARSSYISFGVHTQRDGTDDLAAKLGIELESSGILGSETSTITEYDQWLSLMTPAG
jgi:benzoate/toluate 1,2-dioxygenase alpha subunit